MKVNEYQHKALRTEADPFKIKDRLRESNLRQVRLLVATLGLTSDAGEVAGLVQKSIEYGRNLDMDKLKEELGDCLWRLVQAADAAGFTMEEVMQANLSKLKARYPDGYSDERANNRDDSREKAAMQHLIVQDGHGFGHVGPSEFLAGESKPRTMAEVREARKRPGIGCCDRYADRMACDCMERATDYRDDDRAAFGGVDDDPKPKDC